MEDVVVALRAMGFSADAAKVRAWSWGGLAVDAVVTDAPPEVVCGLLPCTRWEPMAAGLRAFF